MWRRGFNGKPGAIAMRWQDTGAGCNMPEHYRDTILRLIQTTPFGIDTDLQVGGRMPTLANSEFLTNKEQGDWAEQIALAAINESSNEYRAVKYGRDDSLSAGDPGFREFYEAYQEELNTIGKKPDLLIYRRSELPGTAHTIWKTPRLSSVRQQPLKSGQAASWPTATLCSWTRGRGMLKENANESVTNSLKNPLLHYCRKEGPTSTT